jgi:hypothetical protein
LKAIQRPTLEVALNTRLFRFISLQITLSLLDDLSIRRPRNARRSRGMQLTELIRFAGLQQSGHPAQGRLFSPVSTLGVESGRTMEIFLNLAWTSLAILSLGLWMRFERRTGRHRRMPLIALVMLLVILFPVISVSDDLWSIQNPAETDTCQRRHQIAPNPHSIIPVLAAPLAPLFARVTLDVQYFSAPIELSTDRYGIPALEGIDNRPPPAA